MLPAPNPGWAAFARAVIVAVVQGRDRAACGAPVPAPRDHGGVFVTLHRAAALRGCMGLLDGTLALADAIRQAAVCAATGDPRFPPLRSGELADLRVEVSVLSGLRRMQRLDELELGRHGILVRCGARRGLFLPQVATEHHLDRETFLSRCCSEKAGLAPGAWRAPETEVLLFTTEVDEG